MNMSSSPSPFTSATASIGPSVESSFGMSGSRSKSANSFSRCTYGRATWSVTSVSKGVTGWGFGAGRATASDSRIVIRWFAVTCVRRLTRPSRPGHSTLTESSVSRGPTPNVRT